MSKNYIPEHINITPVYSSTPDELGNDEFFTKYPMTMFEELVRFTNNVGSERESLMSEKEILLERIKTMRDSRNETRNKGEAVRLDFQSAVDDQEPDDMDSPFFSIKDVNELLAAMYFDEIGIDRQFEVDVTVTVSFTVQVEARNADQARDIVDEDVNNNFTINEDSVQEMRGCFNIDSVEVDVTE